MAQRHEIEAWVNPRAWDDQDEAHAVIDAIEASGSDDEAEWARIAGGDALDVVSAAARDVDRANAEADAALVRRDEAIRAARAAGSSLSAIGQAAGISLQRVHRIIKD